MSTLRVAAVRFVMIPGMGADERLFDPQRSAGLRFEVPRLPMPDERDTMRSYASRVREAWRLNEPCIVGGVSFGAMLACELATICPAQCVIMIAGCRSRAAIARHCWPCEWASRLLPESVLRHAGVITCRRMARREPLTDDQHRLARDMFLDAPVLLLRRLSRLALGWKHPSPVACRVHHIHGAADALLPPRRVNPDEWVPGGGHLINMTHAGQVNRFIERCLTHSIAGLRA